MISRKNFLFRRLLLVVPKWPKCQKKHKSLTHPRSSIMAATRRVLGLGLLALVQAHITQRPSMWHAPNDPSRDTAEDVSIAALEQPRELSTCLQGSSECTDMCTDGGQCNDKPDPGESCNDGNGPTNNVCRSDCTPCGDTVATSAPTYSPAPTAEIINYWSKTCDTKTEKPCMPHWCEVSDQATCSLASLPVEANAETYLLDDLKSLECNPYCTQTTNSPHCTQLAEIFMTSHVGIKAAYCTDLFLVVWSLGYPNHISTLEKIPVPPGGTETDGSDCKVRSRYEQYQVYKIPLNVTNAYGFSPAFAPKHGGSLIPSSLGSREDGGVDLGIRLPISGAIGVAINGVPIYPSFDNADYVVWEVCEGDACSSHSGKGGDYHYHGDPYGAYCMYNQSDYGGPYEHPPIIGFAADGYVIYGRYTANTQDGQEEDLDDCGGHAHTGMPYHYHPSVQQDMTSVEPGTTNGNNFTSYWMAPKYCFKGNVTAQPNFWTLGGGQWNYDRSFDDYVIADATDSGYLRACCGSEHYYEAEDATVRVASGPDDGFAEFCVQTSESSADALQAEVTIDCESTLSGSVIESLTFACYGNPSGSCSGDPFYYHGCCATNSFSMFDHCVGLSTCTIQTSGFMSSLPDNNGAADSTACPNIVHGKFKGVCKAAGTPVLAPTQGGTPMPSVNPVPNPTKVPVFPPTPLPTTIPVPEPTKVPVFPPTPLPTGAPVPEPTSLPVPAPTSLPTMNPVPNPTSVPVPAPSPQPTFEPTVVDTVTVAVALSMTISATSLSTTEEDALLSTIATTVGVDASNIKNFVATVSARRHRRKLLASTVSVSFDVVTDLSSTSSASASEYEETISTSLTTNLATNVNSNTDLAAISSMVDTSSIATVLETRNPSQAPYSAPTASTPVAAPVVDSSPSSQPTTAESEAKSDASTAGAIIGAVVGVVVLAGAGVALYFKVSNDRLALQEEEEIAMQVTAFRRASEIKSHEDSASLETKKPNIKDPAALGSIGVSI